MADPDLTLFVLDRLSDGVAILDTEWVCRYANEAAATFLHTTVGAMVGASYHEVYTAPSDQAFTLACERVMATGVSEVVEAHSAPWDQHFRNRVLSFGTGIMLFLEDVSAQRRRDEADRLSHDLLQQVIDSAPVGIVLRDIEGRYRLVNRFTAELTGTPVADMLGRRADAFLPAHLASDLAATVAYVRRTGEPVRGDVRVPGPDGHDHFYESVIFATRDAQGALTGTGGVYSDVSVRERALEELRETYADVVRFQALVEASEDFIAMTDLDGAVRYVNPAGRTLVGMPDDVDVTRTNLPDYLTGVGLDHVLHVERPAVLASERWSGRSSLRDWRDGEPIPVTVSMFVMLDPATSEPLGIASVQRDIRPRLAAELALQQVAAQRSELLDRLVAAQEEERARIAADVHDDSVQSLAAVDLRLGVLHRLMSETASPKLVSVVEKLQETVSGATERLRQLLFDLEPPATGVGLPDVLRDIAGHVFEDAATTWDVQARADTDLPYGSKVKAVRIVKQALTNAHQHAGASHVSITVQDAVGGLEIAVVDDGVGSDPQTVRSAPGHRGLVTMADQAAVAGGWLRLERTPGGGTTVRFWLPAEELTLPPGDDRQTG